MSAQPRSRRLTQTLAAAPFVALVPVVYGVLWTMRGGTLGPRLIVLGAVGWTVALALRAPVSVVAKQRTDDPARIHRIVGLASGPCEEIVRFALVGLLGARGRSEAFSFGLGWGGIEVLYAIGSGVALALLLRRGGEKADEITQAMSDLGMPIHELNPFLGILERIGGTAFHIGATLVVAAFPPAVIALVPLHTAANFGALAVIRRGAVRGEIIVSVGGLAMLALGLVLL